MILHPPSAGIARCEIPTPSGAVYRPGSVIYRNEQCPRWFDWLLAYNFILPAAMSGKPLAPPAASLDTSNPLRSVPTDLRPPASSPGPKRRSRRKVPPSDALA